MKSIRITLPKEILMDQKHIETQVISASLLRGFGYPYQVE